MKITPRVYQVAAVKAATQGLKSPTKRALVVLATGLGKTLTAALTTQEMQSKRTLFLVHNNFILQHAVEEFGLVFDSSTRMAIYNGLSKEGAEDAQIVFATWQTMGKNLRYWGKDHFDLTVVDEAHHTGAKTYLPILEHFKAARLGITATPDRSDKVNIRSIFGAEVANVTLEEAIARNWLPRIEYHVITDESLNEEALQKIVTEIREGKKRFTMAEVNRRIFIRKRDEEITRIINGYDEKAIVFCANIKHAERVAQSLHRAATFHSTTGTTQEDTWQKNQSVLADLQSGTIHRVCAVNAFNEGVNVPTVGLVAFCRATNVPTIFRQQLGRGLRPGKDKLIVLDFVGNLERIQLVQTMVQRIADLHEHYTSEAGRARENYRRDSIEVSGKGFEFTFSDVTVDILSVLKRVSTELYPTHQEASAAALKLGIHSSTQYKRMYHLDDSLPCNPDQRYSDFPGWKKFLARDKYKTWQEASLSARTLGARNAKEYQALYNHDRRLYAEPVRYYPDFPGWKKFLHYDESRNFYTTLEEAEQAARALKIHSSKQYRIAYKQDPRLHRTPNAYYPDFPGWTKFLGSEELYPTSEEASNAAINLGIKNSIEYQTRYKEDVRLPSSPWLKYSDFPGWYAFLNREKGAPTKIFHPDWEMASKAAIQLGISTAAEYRKLYRQDPLLPSNPEWKYSDFPGWYAFLNREKESPRYSVHPDWEMASKAAIQLGISTAAEYRKLYRQDPFLPSNPNQKYSDFPGWKIFLGTNPTAAQQ